MLEAGYKLSESVKGLRFTAESVSAALANFFYSVAGPTIVAAAAFEALGYDSGVLVSYVLIGHGIGALFSAFLSLKYKVPTIIAPSLNSVIVATSMAEGMQAGEVTFAIMVTGVVVAVVGLSGLFEKLVNKIPINIVFGMLAGIVVKQVMKVVTVTMDSPLPSFIVIAVFLATPLITKKIPQQITTILATAAVIFLFFRGDVADVDMTWINPTILAPIPSVRALSICIPLFFIIVSDMVAGFGVLRSNDYNPAICAMTVCSAISMIISSLGMCPAITLGNVATGLTSSPNAGPYETRYTTGVCKAIFSGSFAICAPFILSLVLFIPTNMMNLLAGLMLMSVVARFFTLAFSGKHKMGAFSALVVALSGASVGSIGTGLLALIVGLAASLCLDRADYKKAA